jgi:Na+/proline symporter
MSAAGPAPEEQPRVNMPGIYGLTFVLSLLAAVILALIINQANASGVIAGARIGFLLWLGFILTVRVTEALFNGTNMRLAMIDSGYRLIWAVIMGVIIAAWR